MAQALGIFKVRYTINRKDKRCKLRDILNLCSSVVSLISGNRPFHARGAATAMPDLRKTFVADRGCTRRLCVARLLECPDCCFWIGSQR